MVPDLPTMAESGFPGFDATAWFALLAPAGTPEPIGNTPEEFAAAIKSETPQWAKVIKEAGAKLAD